MKVAYLINQYPKVSHSFIRREIAALERLGVAVDRYSLRPTREELVDPADRAEQLRTFALLSVGVVGLAAALLSAAVRTPLRFLAALRQAARMGRRSEAGLLRHCAYLAEACVLVRRLRASDAAHLHAHFGTNSAAVAVLTRLLGGPPYSFTIHGPEEFDGPESLSLGEKIDGAAFVATVSLFGRSQALRWCPHAQWPKIHVIRCGVDEAFLAGPVSNPANNRLVCVGRLSEQKGQLVLLDALARLARERIPFEMVIVGDGPMREDLEAEIRRLGLQGRVRIAGWMSNDEVRRELLESRATVLPSLAEGLPVVLMEALALGRPAVSTMVAGIPELVRDGVCGWLVPAGSSRRLTEAIRAALQASPERLAEMGAVGAGLVARHHNAATEAGRLADLFAKGAAVFPADPAARPAASVRGGSAAPAPSEAVRTGAPASA